MNETAVPTAMYACGSAASGMHLWKLDNWFKSHLNAHMLTHTQKWPWYDPLSLHNNDSRL